MRVIFGVVLSFLLFLSAARAQNGDSETHGLSPGERAVGFRLIEEPDHSRAVTGGSASSTVHPRPVRMYLWYPAEDSDDARSMRFGRYAALADEDIWPAEIAGDLRGTLGYSQRVLARSLEPDEFEKLLQRPVLAVEGAEALAGPFPLIVMAQGLYYESPVVFAALAEYLAGSGFVVATCPLVGTSSPIVRMDVQDLETFVRDLEFVIARARRLPFVSQDRLGVFGFDMGGMAGLILAMRNVDVDAFVSVSSGILYENPTVGIPEGSPHYDPLALRAPWLHSVPVSWMTPPPDSQTGSLFDAAVHSDRYLLLTKEMGHVDYTSYALIQGRKEMSAYWAASKSVDIEAHKAVVRYVYAFFAAFLKQDAVSLALFARDPQEVIPGSAMTLEHRPATPASISYEEFVQAVLAGQADRAIERVRALKESQPDHMLLNETYLERLVWSLRDTWGLTQKVMPVIKFRAELFPASSGAQWMLAQGYTDTGDYPAAIEVYGRLLEQNPDNSYIQSRLEWLRNQ